MKVLVIDGQGGKMGRALVENILKQNIPCELVAIGTNALATEAMLKGGATAAATGENPVVVNAKDADVIAGPMGIIAANALLGEVTPSMALAVSESRALKVLIPVNRCGIFAAGTEDKNPAQYIESAVRKIAEICR
ncbi:MAG: DUF3842 family protein [Firmicutes bacterium]|nr:DUF3842 family protein [Bacillota bacterium]